MLLSSSPRRRYSQARTGGSVRGLVRNRTGHSVRAGGLNCIGSQPVQTAPATSSRHQSSLRDRLRDLGAA